MLNMSGSHQSDESDQSDQSNQSDRRDGVSALQLLADDSQLTHMTTFKSVLDRSVDVSTLPVGTKKIDMDEGTW